MKDEFYEEISQAVTQIEYNTEIIILGTSLQEQEDWKRTVIEVLEEYTTNENGEALVIMTVATTVTLNTKTFTNMSK